MSLTAFTLRLSLKCYGCEHPVPVKGIREQVTCASCGQLRGLPLAVWRDLFEPEYWL